MIWQTVYVMNGGNPARGIKVWVNGTSRSAVTDENGRVDLQADEGDAIVIDPPGYQPDKWIAPNFPKGCVFFLVPLAAPPADIISIPSRDEIFASLRADIAPDESLLPWLERVEGRNEAGADMIGTWRWLFLDDEIFARTMNVYVKTLGLRLVPCNARIRNYQGFSGDLTHDPVLLAERLARVYRHGGIPMLCLDFGDGDGCGQESLATAKRILPEIAGLIPIVFTAWELNVGNGPSQFTAAEHEEMILLYRFYRPDGIVAVEFKSSEDRDDAVTYDGRAESEFADYWASTTGKAIDIVALQVPAGLIGDLPRFVDATGGAVCRLRGPWGSDAPNWRVDYGIRKRVMLFEYSSWQRLTHSQSKAIRQAVEAVGIPLDGYGEG